MIEMLEIIENARKTYENDITDYTENEYIREALLNAGYKKPIISHWIIRKGGPNYQFSPDLYECANCRYLKSSFSTPYCPLCGAFMNRENDERN